MRSVKKKNYRRKTKPFLPGSGFLLLIIAIFEVQYKFNGRLTFT
jgi:hypothetical protein